MPLTTSTAETIRSFDKPGHYDVLVRTQRSRIMSYFKQHLSEEDAEDLTQDVFLAAFRKLDYQNETASIAWLYRTAARRLIDHYRERRTSHPLLSLTRFEEDTEQEGDGGVAETGYAIIQTRLWMQSLWQIMLRACSPNQISVLRAFYRLGSLDAVAEELDVEPATVRSHFLRGRAALLAELIAHQAELIGGESAVTEAICTVQKRACDRFTDKEYTALAAPRASSKAYRSACLRIAPLLSEKF